MNTWRRLNTASFLLVIFLLLGLGSAIWGERRASAARRHNELLDLLALKVRADLTQLSDAFRGALVNPPAPEERARRTDTEKSLLGTLDSLPVQHFDHPTLLTSARALRDFLSRDCRAFHLQALTLADTDPAKAREFYAQKAEANASLRESLLNTFVQEVAGAKTAETQSANAMIAIAVGGLTLMAIATVVALWFQARAIRRPLVELVATLDQMREGDFCRRIRWSRSDEFGVLGAGLNRLADDLSALVGQVQRSGIQVNTCATEIAATAKEQQTTAAEIAATTAEIGATSKEISATSNELVKTMNEVNGVAEETAHLANRGQSGISRMETTMHQIMDAAGGISAKLTVLNEKTANINSMVTTITKVADQTNLLSLNAAIEAEKAGEYGLGFAVVAMEIRRLADQTAVATYDIEKMVKEMRSAVAAGVMGMDKFSEEVRRGVEEIRQVSTQLGQIINQVQTLSPRFQAVNEGMHAQAAGAHQISETLSQLGESAHQTAQSLRQSNQVIEQLNDAARLLQTSVARFKLESR